MVANNSMLVGAFGGLADRTRVLFSYLQFARSQQKTLSMLWEHNNHLAGKYVDVFKPLQDVEFLYGKRLKDQYKEVAFYCGPAAHPDFKAVNLLVHEMIPLPSVVEAVRATLDRLQHNFVALHVRRFDLERNSELMGFDPFDCFLVDRLKPDQKIFLATDAMPTQERFREKYGNKLVVFRDIEWVGYYGKRQQTWQRQTDLFHTIVDLFVCVFSQEFLGTQRDIPRYARPRLSGFSALIEKFRRHYQQAGLPDWL